MPIAEIGLKFHLYLEIRTLNRDLNTEGSEEQWRLVYSILFYFNPVFMEVIFCSRVLRAMSGVSTAKAPLTDSRPRARRSLAHYPDDPIVLYH